MSRALVHCRLAIICFGVGLLATATAGSPLAPARLAFTLPPQIAAAEAGTQNSPEQQAEAAEQALRQDIARIEQLRLQYPNSTALNETLTKLRSLLDQVLQAKLQIRQEHATLGENAGSLSGHHHAKTGMPIGGLDPQSALAEQAQAKAKEGQTMVASTIATLPPVAPPPTAGPHQPEAPVLHAKDEENSSSEAQWFKKLQSGLLQYSVPPTMLWKVPSTVTIRILGEKAAASGPLDGQQGQGSLKVARQMKVLVSAPENPDEFVIAPEEGTQVQQYVPKDGETTWRFSVTPRYTGSARKLMVQAWVVYDANTQRELPVYTAQIDVHVPGLVECVKRLFEGDPDYWLKYGLPGGGGFVFIAGIVVGIRKWAATRKRNPSSDH